VGSADLLAAGKQFLGDDSLVAAWEHVPFVLDLASVELVLEEVAYTVLGPTSASAGGKAETVDQFGDLAVGQACGNEPCRPA